jgi:phospholipase/lecithinase/hemolysin
MVADPATMIPMFSKLFCVNRWEANYQQAITFNVQLEQYKNVSALLEKELGALATQELISRSLFLICVGTNDIVFGNRTNPTTQKQYNTTQYTNLMLEAYESGIKTLYASGTRKIVLFGEGVDGCEPVARLQNNSQCVDFFNELALEFEAGLKQLVDEFHVTIPGLHLVLAYQYNIEHDMITKPQSFGM